MDNFVYCYLSPFMLGLLWVIAVVVGLICAIAAICFVGGKIKERYDRNIPYYSITNKIVGGIGKWTNRITTTLGIVFFVTLISFGIWDLGLAILKRVACR